LFAAWGSWVARFRWPVFTVALAAVLGAGVWGMGVFGQLSEGGYNDPGSESTRAAEVVQDALGAQGGDVVVIYTPTSGGIDDAALAERVAARLNALPRTAVSASTSYWAAERAPQYASADRRSAVAVLTLAGEDDSAKLAAYREIDDRLTVSGARTQVAGGVVLGDASSSLSTRDLALAEAISLPIVLILLLFVFGSLVAAALPVLVGGAAVLGSLGVLHAIALTHNVNSFAVNVASLLGLGMAIDYGLFMVGRFREEQGYGRTPAEAVTRTVATAGRTVLFSATLLMIALAGLLLFPQGFLKSLAYGGLAAVALAAFLSLTLLPALLAVLGPRVDTLPIRLPGRRGGRPAGTGWARLADVVLRHPVLVALPLLAGLLVLAAPIRDVHFGEQDERILPASEPARQAIETLKADFPALSSVGIQVVLRGTRGEPPEEEATSEFAARLARVRGVADVTPAGTGEEVVVFTATPAATDPFADEARDTVGDIRALRPPADTELLVGGTTARNVDSLEATADRLPLMIGLLVGATLLLMFLAFGSVLLPVKAVVVSALSLCATFGILVWVFQEGHGAGLLQVTPAPLEVGIVVLMAAVVFGLSTDYEVFLLSRMVEARTRGATTAEAVTTGLARTGRVISAAALLLIVVTGAFALSSVTTMRFVGVGMIIALVLDATVVRMLFVPALLRLMGPSAWWAPGPLRRLQERAGLAEYAGEELFPTVSVGRHAAPDDAVATSSSARPRHASRASVPVSPASPSAASSPLVSSSPTSPAPSGSAPASPPPSGSAPASPPPSGPAPALAPPAPPAAFASAGPASGRSAVPVSPGAAGGPPESVSPAAPGAGPTAPPGAGPASVPGASPASIPVAGPGVAPFAGSAIAPFAGSTATPAAGSTATPAAGSTADPGAGTTTTPPARPRADSTADPGAGPASAGPGTPVNSPELRSPAGQPGPAAPAGPPVVSGSAAVPATPPADTPPTPTPPAPAPPTVAPPTPARPPALAPPPSPAAGDDPPTVRIPTGEQATIRVGNGERPGTAHAEPPTVQFRTGGEPDPARAPRAEPARVPTGEQPSVGVAAVPPAPEDGPADGPETTAVLEARPTVDLTGRGPQDDPPR
jgi:uncharacterized membrane protein YdfJ with MMPL/SSD domain